MKTWIAALAFVLALLPTVVLAQQDFDKVEIQSTKLGDRLYMLTGDTFFNGRYPFIELSSGGSVDGVISSADRVLSLINNETQLISGHGPPGKRADLKAYWDVVQTARDRVAAAIAQGKTLEETVAAGVMKEYDPEWGAGFMPPERFVTFVYLSLTGQGGP